MFKRTLFLSLIGLFLSFSLQANDGPGEKAIKSLNNFVFFTNTSIEQLVNTRHALQDFNRMLNEYYRRRIDTIYLAPIDMLSGVSSNGKTIDELYTVLKDNREEQLLDRYHNVLMVEATDLLVIMQDIQQVCDELHAYTNKRMYKTDTDFAYPYLQLYKLSNLFTRFKWARDHLNETLKNVHKAYRVRLTNRKMSSTYEMMNAWHNVSDSLMFNLEEADSLHVQVKLAQLKTLQNKIAGLVKVDIDLEDDSKIEGFIQVFDDMKSNGEAYLNFARKYIGHFPGNKFSEKCGRTYFHPNDYNLIMANDASRTFTSDCNDFIELTGELYLQFIEEVPIIDFIDAREKDKPSIDWDKENPRANEQPLVSQPSTPVATPVAPKAASTPIVAEVKPKVEAIPSLATTPSTAPTVEVPVTKVEAKPMTIQTAFEQAAPINLVLLLDVSSSMDYSYKLPLLKTAMAEALLHMRPEDRISLVIYSGEARLLLRSTACRDIEVIKEAINEMESGSYTNVDKGLKLAYLEANRHFIKGGNNRIIMATDGQFLIKESTKDLIKRKSAGGNVDLSVFYFDLKERSNTKKILEELAQKGNGSYAYINRDNAIQTLVQVLTDMQIK